MELVALAVRHKRYQPLGVQAKDTHIGWYIKHNGNAVVAKSTAPFVVQLQLETSHIATGVAQEAVNLGTQL